MHCYQASGDNSSPLPKWPADQNLLINSACKVANGDELLRVHRGNTEHDNYLKSVSKSNMNMEEKSFNSGVKQPLLDGSFAEEGLKKLDSFNQWMSKELGDVSESHMQTSSRAYWDSVETDNCVEDSSQVRLDNYVLSPSLSQEQLFSIIDFSPNWAYEISEVKVLLCHPICSSIGSLIKYDSNVFCL